MNADIAKQILDKIVGQSFGYQNPWTLEQFAQKYAFDVRLPSQVYDSTTNEPTWASSPNPTKFITLTNSRKRSEIDDLCFPNGRSILSKIFWLPGTKPTIPQQNARLRSINFAESDLVYNSAQNVYRTVESVRSKNVLFSESAIDSEFVAALQRSINCSFVIRVEDSQI